jgi:hypothetical protein
MPTYDFRNKETGEVIERIMSIAAKAEYLKDNPHMEPIITGLPPLIDPVRLGIHKPDQGFKEVLQRIDEKTAGSRLKDFSNHL